MSMIGKVKTELGIAVYSYYPSAWEVKVRGLS